MAYIFVSALPAKEFSELNEPDNAKAPDVSGSPYAKEINTLLVSGVVTGNDLYGTYTPDANITRCEAAAIIARVIMPEQRRQVLIMEKWNYDSHVSAVKPVGSTPVPGAADGADEGMDVNYGPAGIAVYRTINLTGGMDGLSILNVPREELKNEIASGLGADAKVTAETIYFGSAPAYRFDFTMSAGDGADLTGCYYVFLSGHDMYMVVIGVLHPEGQIAAPEKTVLMNMANSVTLDGNGPSVKVK